MLNCRLFKIRRTTALLGVVLPVYVLSYVPRRVDGSYSVTQSGKIRYGLGTATSDIEQWNPKNCWWQPGFIDIDGAKTSRGNRAGYWYSPLIAIDRKLNFPDKRLP